MEDKQTIISVGNSYSSISGYEPPGLFNALGNEIVSWRKVFNYKTKKRETQRFVRNVSLYNTSGSFFPTGVIGRVIQHCKKYHTEVTIKDTRKKPVHEPYKIRKDIETRDAAEEGIESILNIGRGILLYSTSLGKTRIATRILATIGCKTLYIVPGKGLLRQAQNDLSEYIDEEIGIVGDKQCDISLDHIPAITVITISSLWSIYKNRPDLFKKLAEEIECYVVDEAHHTRKKESPKQVFNTWFILLMKLTNVYYRIGMTGTLYNPESFDCMLLEAATGRVRQTITRKEAQDLGYVCPFEAWYFPVQCPDTKGWQLSYKAGIVLNDRHNNMVIAKAREMANIGRKVIVIFDEVINHLNPVSKRIPEAAVLIGDSSGEERLEVQRKFVDGEYNIILSTVMSEGINVPAIDCIILAAGKGADDTVMVSLPQRVGRGSRNTDDPNKVLIIIDFLHIGNPILHKHSMNRMRIMKELGGVVKVFKNSTHVEIPSVRSTK